MPDPEVAGFRLTLGDAMQALRVIRDCVRGCRCVRRGAGAQHPSRYISSLSLVYVTSDVIASRRWVPHDGDVLPKDHPLKSLSASGVVRFADVRKRNRHDTSSGLKPERTEIDDFD